MAASPALTFAGTVVSALRPDLKGARRAVTERELELKVQLFVDEQIRIDRQRRLSDYSE